VLRSDAHITDLYIVESECCRNGMDPHIKIDFQSSVKYKGLWLAGDHMDKED
jgi:hypothetical protein